MRLLVICSTLEMDKPYGATPFVWQFLKGLSEVGCELTVVTYLGRSIRTPWWNSVKNPNRIVGEAYERLVGAIAGINPNLSRLPTIRDQFIPKLASTWVLGRWKNLIDNLARSDEFDLCLVIGVPLNHVLKTLAELKRKSGKPVVYYDLDAPTSLPASGGFSFSHHLGVSYDVLDMILVPSVGSKKDLESDGARVEVLHFGVDTKLYCPLDLKKDVGVFFFGSGAGGRERYVNDFMVRPAAQVRGKFVLAGAHLTRHRGNIIQVPKLRFNEVRNFACRSKINLNIPRDLQATVEATSTSRPFELGAWECCVVSRPYSGLGTWFDLGTEMLVASNFDEVIKLYEWLLDDDEARMKLGKAARDRVLAEHTIWHRAEQFVQMTENLAR